jgi:hypothetical protein
MIMTNKKYLHEDISDSPADQEKLKSVQLPLDAELTGNQEDSDDDSVTATEKKILTNSFDPSFDTDLPIESISLDDSDNEGDLLEESAQSKDLFGKDLDDNLIEEEDEETDGEGQQ